MYFLQIEQRWLLTSAKVTPKLPQGDPKPPSYTQSKPKVTHKRPQSGPKLIVWLHKIIKICRQNMFFVNGSKWFRSKLHILKLAPSCTKLPKSGRKVSPEWPKNRPLARTPNGVKSLKFIVKMWVFCKLNSVGCSLRPKWQKSGPKVTQSHPHILKVSPKLPTSAPKAGPKLTL